MPKGMGRVMRYLIFDKNMLFINKKTAYDSDLHKRYIF